MDRVSSTGYQTIGSRRTWQDKNLGAGIQGTTFDQVWFAGVQESIIAFAEQTGITPVDQTLGNADLQAVQGTRRIASGNSNGGAPITAATATLTADNAGLVVVSGASNNVAITLPAAASAGGQMLRYRFARTDSTANAVTVALAGGDTVLFGAATSPVSVPGPGVLELIGDGISKWCVVWGAPSNYAFNLSAPPSSPIALAPRDRLTVTFSAVSAIALHCACVPGLYKATVVISASNTTNSDIFWKPNDTTYSGAFFGTVIQAADTGSGATVSSSPTTVVTAGHPAIDGFFFDQFGGPSGSDTTNDIGPSLAEYLISTSTAAKMIKQSSGIMGGPAIGFVKWLDTTTAWTSLGTIVDENGTSLSGTVVVERMA